MRRALQLLPVAVVLGTALVGCGAAQTTDTTTTTQASTVGCVTTGATAVASTKSYRIVADVRPVAAMFAPGQIPSGTRTGEVMYAGSMTSASGPDARDVDVYICSASGDRVLTGVKPVISLEDVTTGATQTVPYATMQGVGQGKSDFHYGNTMVLPPGHLFILTVSVEGQSAQLRFSEPRASAPGSSTSTTMAKMKMSTTTAKMSTTTTAKMKMSTTTTAKMKMSTTTTAKGSGSTASYVR